MDAAKCTNLALVCHDQHIWLRAHTDQCKLPMRITHALQPVNSASLMVPVLSPHGRA